MIRLVALSALRAQKERLHRQLRNAKSSDERRSIRDDIRQIQQEIKVNESKEGRGNNE